MAETPGSVGPTALTISSQTIATAPSVASVSQTNATTTNGSNKVTGVTADDRWIAGMTIEGSANIPAGTKIIAKNAAGTELYMSANATGTSSTVTITGFQWLMLRELTVTNTTNANVNVTVGIGTSNTDTAAKQILPNVTVQPGWPLEKPLLTLQGGSTPQLLYALMPGAGSPSGALNVYAVTVTGP